MPDPSNQPNPEASFHTLRLPAQFDREQWLSSARRVVSLFETGVGITNQIGGWHGTNFSAIELTLIHGRFPVSPGTGLIAPGYLYYYPALEREAPLGAEPTSARGREGAASYAWSGAKIAFVMESLGLPYGNGRYAGAIEEAINFVRAPGLGDRDARRALAAVGLDTDRVLSLVHASSNRQGILVGLHRDALSRYPMSDGDIGGRDKKLYAPSGISLNDIVGLEPMGEYELGRFEQLQALLEQK